MTPMNTKQLIISNLLRTFNSDLVSLSTISTNKKEFYLTIKYDKKFNIYLLFNLLKTLFLEKFNIPSLKNSLEHFNNWFEGFFKTYDHQFNEPLNKTKVYNALKYQFRQQFISQLTKLLPQKYEISEPQTFQERRDESIRYANFHILTCKNEECILLTKKQYDSSNIFK